MKVTSVWGADFETTGKLNLQKDGKIRVWLWSLVKSDMSEEYYGTEIETFVDKIKELNCQVIFFHNLRFDGQSLVNHFIDAGWIYGVDYQLILSSDGIWYEIKIMNGKNVIKIWDSLKKFPGLSVANLAKMYNYPDKKAKPHFESYRGLDYQPTEEEIEYCLQDSRIVAYAIGIEWEKGHRAMTLSSDAFKEVQKSINAEKGGFWKHWRNYMPELSKEWDEWIRPSYKGGWTYLNPTFADKTLENVKVYDVNSLYPWVMHDCLLPYGNPAKRKPKGGELYLVKFVCDFELNEGYLPMIQIKGRPDLYKGSEYLKRNLEPAVLTMTSVDYEMFIKHYEVDLLSEPYYVSFRAKTGLLAPYIDKWTDVKIQATESGDKAERFISKRYLNSPYGKTGMKIERVNRIPIGRDENGKIKFSSETTDAEPKYVPYASFVCAQARKKTIETAQAEYDHFIYADTDSVHLIGEAESGIEVHDTKLGAWKLEGEFELGKYLRAKTYIHGHRAYTMDVGTMGKLQAYEIEVDEIKCAGMSDNIKNVCTWERFRIGETFSPETDGVGKLVQHGVNGGCLLTEMPFTIKENTWGYL